jgi:hypothetical protein
MDGFFGSIASEVATMQGNWQENWKEGEAGRHDGQARPYSGETTSLLYHSSTYCQVVIIK